MKKVVALVLAVMIAMSFAACGSGNEAANGEVPTITWYVHGDKQQDVATVMDAVNKITVEKIGAKLDLQFIDQPSYTEKMSMMMAAGQPFDICFTGYVNPYRQVAQRGGLLALDEYLKEMPELYNAIPEYTWDTTKVNGEIYAVPNLQIIAYQINFFTFKDLADKYGLTSELEPLERIGLSQMENYLKKLRDNEPSYYPIRFNYNSTHFNTYDNPVLTSYMDTVVPPSNGVHAYYDENGKLLEIDSALYKEGTEWSNNKAREWYNEGLIREDILSMSNDAAEHAAGKYASWVEKWKPGILQELEQRYGKEVVSFQLTEPVYPSTAPDAMTGISKTSKNPELALKMLELVNTDKEVYNLICFGVEGKHYNLDENGRVVYNDEGGYIPKAAWKFGNQFNALLLPGQPDDVWEQTRELNDTAVRSPLAGFSFDQANSTNEMAALSSVEGEYLIMHKGAVEPGPLYEEHVKAAKAAGLDKLIEEAKKQYEEWVKTK